MWTTPRQDVYIALTRLDDQRAAVNLYRYPLMWLLWAAGLLVVLGGAWALGAHLPVPRRLRPATAAHDESSAADAAPAVASESAEAAVQPASGGPSAAEVQVPADA